MTRDASDQTIMTTTAQTKQRTSSGAVAGAEFFANGQSFMKRLQKNNNKEWFHANKSEYEQNIKQPAKLFADQLTQLLSDATGQSLQAKIFRINRDLRFSTDKSPYRAATLTCKSVDKRPCQGLCARIKELRAPARLARHLCQLVPILPQAGSRARKPAIDQP